MSENHEQLCQQLVDGGTAALRAAFSHIHPPDQLPAIYARPDIQKTLRRLWIWEVISQEQWEILFPPKCKDMSVEHYDLDLTIILLRYICSLPMTSSLEGTKLPQSRDKSTQADINRILWFIQYLSQLEHIPDTDHAKFTGDLNKIFTRLQTGTPKGPTTKQKQSKYYQRNFEGVIPTSSTSSIKLSTVSDNNSDCNDIRCHENTMNKVETNTQTCSHNPEMMSYGDIVKYYHKILCDLAKLEQNIVTSLQEESNDISLLTKPITQGRRSKQSTWIVSMESPAAPECQNDDHDDDGTQQNESIPSIGIKDLTQNAASVPTVCDNKKALLDMIVTKYQEKFSEYSPIPWHSERSMDLEDYYVPQYITDSKGQKFEPKNIIENLENLGKDPTRLMIQGAAGAGKTTLLEYITYQWSKEYSSWNNHGNHLLLYLPVNELNNLESIPCIIRNTWLLNSGISEQTLKELLTQYNVTYIIDDFHLLSPTAISQLQEGTFSSNSNIIASVYSMYSELSSSVTNLFTTKYSLLGLRHGGQSKIIQNYKCLTNSWQDGFSVLIAELQDKTSPLYKLSLCGFNCLALCATAEANLSSNIINTKAQLLSEWFNSLPVIYRKRMEMNHLKHETQNSISKACSKIENAAIDCARFHTNTIANIDCLNNVCPLLVQLGILIDKYGHYQFSSQLVINYLAAKSFILNPCLNKHQFSSLVHDPKLNDLCTLICGLCHKDNNYALMSELFHKLASRNKDHVRVETKQNKQIELDCVNSEDILMSLNCLAECEVRRDMCRLVSFDIPQKVTINMQQKLGNQHYVEGIAAIIELEVAKIAALEINLDECSLYHYDEYMFLSEAIRDSKFMNAVTIHWSSLEILSKFLFVIFHSNRLISKVTLVSKPGNAGEVPNEVISRYRNACSSMTNIVSFTMQDYEDINLVNMTVRNTPNNLKELCIINCVGNVVTAEDIKIKVKRCVQLQKLDLTSTKMNEDGMPTILKSVQFSESLKELKLNDTGLGMKTFTNLAETIRISTSLVTLDISGNSISYPACFHLAMALECNETIQELIMINCGMSVQSQKLFEYLQRPSLLLLGPKHVKQFGKPMFRPMIEVNNSPLLV